MLQYAPVNTFYISRVLGVTVESKIYSMTNLSDIVSGPKTESFEPLPKVISKWFAALASTGRRWGNRRRNISKPE